MNVTDSSLFSANAFWYLFILAILLVVCTNLEMCQGKSNVRARPKERSGLCEQGLVNNNLSYQPFSASVDIACETSSAK